MAKWFQCIKVYVIQRKWKVTALCGKSNLNLLSYCGIGKIDYFQFVTLMRMLLFHSIMFCYLFAPNNFVSEKNSTFSWLCDGFTL